MKTIILLVALIAAVDFSMQASLPMVCYTADGEETCTPPHDDSCATIVNGETNELLTKGCLQETECEAHSARMRDLQQKLRSMNRSQKNLLKIMLRSILEAQGSKPNGQPWTLEDFASSRCSSCSQSKCNGLGTL